MESLIGIIEGKNKDERVEVLLEQDGMLSERLHLRRLSWGEGVGWYAQKTMAFDFEEIGMLRTLLNKTNAILETRKRKNPRAKGNLVPLLIRPKKIQTDERRALKEA